MQLKTTRQKIALFLAFLMLFQIVQAPVALALTAGPSQPEVQSFEPATTTEMVDLFSGDFTYNIPLFELPGPNGGYPFNLAYHAGIGMDQEASWVGLGWNLNPGAITRQMRGLPDEFNGDLVYTKTSMAPSYTVGVGAGVGFEFFGGDVGLGVGLSVYNNNYKGVGYSIDASLGFAPATRNSSYGVGLSLDNREGVSLSPEIGLTSVIGVSAGYNSKEGLSNVGINYPIAGTEIQTKISFVHPSYIPQIGTPMLNTNVSATFKSGAAWWGAQTSADFKGFYNEQKLIFDGIRVPAPAYGYLNYQNGANELALLDFNREKDGTVSKLTPNLPIPVQTYDIYSVTGQGMSAMYRPMRNDVGILRDPTTESISAGFALGVDVSPAVTHVGGNLQINHSRSVSGAWTHNNDIGSRFNFQKKEVNSSYEPWFFKVHGEPSLEKNKILKDLGGEDAVYVKLEGDYLGENYSPSASTKLKNNTFDKEAPNSTTENRERKTRSQVILPLTNDEVLKENNEIESLFKIDYITRANDTLKYDRSTLKGHHFAGYTALKPDGLRYVYALPAYNHRHEDVVFTGQKDNVDQTKAKVVNVGEGDPKHDYNNTEKFLKSTEIPAYAHSYLLTSIVGPDYVDVTGNGVSEDDLGYWVKFTYKNITDNENKFKWRDPFSKAHLSEGFKTDVRDNKGSFVYGEKEIWYLAKAETKSHIATFITELRNDARGVAQKLQDSPEVGMQLHKLKEIKLFTRAAGSSNPIKAVKFDYDYSLCKLLPNNDKVNGKLTLKKLWFEYGSNTKGSLNPYVFGYNEGDILENPNYNTNAYDRWGNYKPFSGDPMDNHDFPYVEQDSLKKVELDRHAAVWSLKEIHLPSGGKVVVDYEADDYAYVQHKQAMQMTEIVDTTDPSNNLYLSKNDLKVQFKLKKPVYGTLSGPEQKAEVLKYLDVDRGQLYFKIKVNLRQPGEDFFEYISGYADIDFSKNMELVSSGEAYTYGSFFLKSEEGHHPISMRAWQHIRVNQPDLASIGKKMEPAGDNGARVSQMKNMVSIFPQIRQVFEGYYNYCNNKGWGKEVKAGKAWVRLKSPDKIKYGGGLRVRQISLFDQWKHDSEGIYGQIYEYTKTEDNKIISSGVAAYEPLIGGDENPLRYAKKFVESVPLRSNNNMYFEYPINEGSYPGPQVGYSEVRVTSLASASLAGKTVKYIENIFPKGEATSYGTTGSTLHEFYTARDFPVMVSETQKENRPYRISVAVPLLGHLFVNRLTTSQGYSIVTNDMHGKLKKISNFRQDREGYLDSNAISWIEYHYKSERKLYEGENVNALVNVFIDNGDQTVRPLAKDEIENETMYSLAQENEFFVDMRENSDVAWDGGVRINTDVILIPILVAIVPVPIPTVWPSVGKTENKLRTVVTNKIIFKSGILEKAEAFDGGSLVTTENLKWDKLTGTPVLTSVNNNFDDPIFSFSTPAYHQYQGMGAAYKNIGFTFEIKDVDNLPFHDNYYQFTAGSSEEHLFPGDEILLYKDEGGIAGPVAKVIFVGEENGDKLIHSKVPLGDLQYKAMIVRSGYRNQLSVNAGTITALEDPSKAGPPVTYQKLIKVPVEN